ncbi:MAG: 4-hydroxy-3-methylbut-2-enyl diphosphate reductase [Hydrotalea flava]|uniref:4-hydroxy-3-methylbut-2-enyl diphosphate reductase n=1 Tax=Hydrotalea lipotrueae TaxID=2803817 RepID=UPI0016A1C7C2|nr:4-hydroxy-3-methylbut-2-enyl diphosphate reductase [Hydrotalea lipotrueae]NIM35779.1 4-hydroxy-3-methylbut-2-enyl diphosphate reductase [Hydrotalea flava]NIM38629.1 4-hydroxy-3-methylbut-2-enyl diphosphate reductase [Hydrotalea flava]NIN03813.1 4-hydroxy-3-methylbut-2-enyl diphosphate reductase [Hydrotalea flava]NIN15507.1 4-hydroxy-3-methylbut-2-enyl diphosphate reductase [Hydrotalea flava]NIO94555.1 4-hydroxy-3-methylbut-2-enyl diphosphate reductase [Hydrotalea flava]
MKQFNVPVFYRSNLISHIKNYRKNADKLKKDFTPTLLDFGPIQIFLARHFGFCYGVENAIEIAFKTIEIHKGKRIFLLSEMIHNPQVNTDLKAEGVLFLQDNLGNQLIPFDELKQDDIVLIPAFGTTLAIEKILHEKGIETAQYNTTCPFVEKVWNRSEQIAQKGYTIIIHGKPKHEETRATFSHAAANTATLIISDMREAIILGEFITGSRPAAEFYEVFKGHFSEGFDVEKDLQKIGVVNQTTQLATDTQAIADYLKNVMIVKYQLTDATMQQRFADTRDTLCYATNDNQTAVTGMLRTPADLAIVIGGYKSSNTSHLVELCEQQLPTYFIDSANKLLDAQNLVHCNWQTKATQTISGYLPGKTPLKILITSGASCPDNIVEAVIERLVSFFPGAKTMEAVRTAFQ